MNVSYIKHKQEHCSGMKVLLLVFLFWSPVTQSQSLEAYLQIAAESNPSIQSAYAQFEAALQQAPQVSSLPDPTLTVSALGRMMETRLGAQEARFTLMQMFPWFGTLKAKEDASVLMAEAKFQEYLDVRNALFFEIRTIYAQMYALEQSLVLQEKNLEILDSYRELALSGFRSGNSPMVNVVKIDIQRESANTEIALARDLKEPLEIRLNSMLNRQPDAPVAVSDTLYFDAVVPVETSVTMFNNHPVVTGLEKQKQAFEMQQVVAEKEGMPMVGLGIDYSIISKRTDANPEMNGQDAIMPMLSVSLPIFRKKYKAAGKEAAFMAASMEYEQEAKKNEFGGRYATAVYELRRAQKLVALYERQLQSSNQANSLLISSFSNATGNFEDVLQMNQDILMLQTQKIEAIKEGFIAQAELEYLFSITELK